MNQFPSSPRPWQPNRPYRPARPAVPNPPAPKGPPPGSENWRTPWVQLKTYSFHPTIYPAMIRGASPDAKPGSLVQIYSKDGQPFGAGLYHPKARVPLRSIYHGHEPIDEGYFDLLLNRALDLRLGSLRLPENTDAFRVIHSDGDGLSGLIIDKFDDVLSVQVHSLGMFQRLPKWLPMLHEKLGTKRFVLEVDEFIARVEGIQPSKLPSDPVKSVKIREHGIRYEIDFEAGHKTGFFCDQRENRRRIAQWTRGKRMLDLCCYTGGFSITAKTKGEAAEVTGVDLDEKAIAQAKRNANLNNARVDWVHCDAFSYARQMQQNGLKWDVVICDPPKLIFSEEEAHEGLAKYEDLNALAISLVAPGGLLVTCSCSGQLSPEHFERIATKAAHRNGRKLQYVDRTGAGEDHPVMSNCPESLYLKLLWARVM